MISAKQRVRDCGSPTESSFRRGREEEIQTAALRGVAVLAAARIGRLALWHASTRYGRRDARRWGGKKKKKKKFQIDSGWRALFGERIS